MVRMNLVGIEQQRAVPPGDLLLFEVLLRRHMKRVSRNCSSDRRSSNYHVVEEHKDGNDL